MPKPYWVQHHLPEPPVEYGYWSYGTVWVAGQAPLRETRRELARLVIWSYRTWGKKVWREIRGVHYGKTKDETPKEELRRPVG